MCYTDNAVEVLADTPPRLDQIPWSRWQLRMAVALSVTFLLDGMEGGVGGKGHHRPSLSMSGRQYQTGCTHLRTYRLCQGLGASKSAVPS